MIRRLDRYAVLLALLGLILALPMLTYPLGRDQGMYANIAQTIRAGGLPFIDMWDIKPPPIYYLYAFGISLFGPSSVALRALDLLALPFTLLALYLLTRALAGRRAARWAMLLFPVFYFTETFSSLTQSDSLVTLPMAWAVLCALRAAQSRAGTRRALAWAFACGFLCAVVMLFKHYYVLFALALALAYLWACWQGQRISVGRALVMEIGAFAAGGLLFGLPIVAYFISTGILNELITIAQGTSQYNMDALSSLSAFWEQIDSYLEFRWWHWGALLVLAASGLLLPFIRRPDEQANVAEDNPVSATPFIVLWIVSSLSFVVIQAKGFDTHWIPLLPPLVVLAARALDKWLTLADNALSRALPARSVMINRAVIVLIIGFFGAILAKDTWLRAWPYLTGEETQRAYYARFQGGDVNAGASLRVANWLRERTNEGESVYIWGFRPEIAFMAGLRPATRFQAQFPLVGERYPQAWKQENVDTLWAVMPQYVIVMRADYMPWVTGIDKDSNTILAEDYQQLRDWLIENYDRDQELGTYFLIWKRKV